MGQRHLGRMVWTSLHPRKNMLVLTGVYILTRLAECHHVIMVKNISTRVEDAKVATENNVDCICMGKEIDS
jgi:hypothetical protein